MKKSKLLNLAWSVALLAGSSGIANAAPYGFPGRALIFTGTTNNPTLNGASLALKVFGDEFYTRIENSLGYTVAYDFGTNSYYYAKLSDDQRSLVPTTTLAQSAAPAGAVRGLDLDDALVQATITATRARFDAARKQRWFDRVAAVRTLREPGVENLTLDEFAALNARGGPVTGNMKGLTLLIEFPDDASTIGVNEAVLFPISDAVMTAFCNGVNVGGQLTNTASVRDYFADQSAGRLNYTQVVKRVTVSRTRNQYNYIDFPANTEVRVDSREVARLIIGDAVTALKNQGFNFSNLSLGLTSAGRKERILATNIMVPGADSLFPMLGLWQHQSELLAPINVGTTTRPFFLSGYQMTDVPNASTLFMGTFCHENGHMLFDFPDLSSFKKGNGVGQYCLMGSGNISNGGKTPSPINPFFKDMVGWSSVTQFTSSSVKVAAIPAPIFPITPASTTAGNIAWQIRKPAVGTARSNESFMVENRGDRWSAFTADTKGVAIWHIDETQDGNNNFNSSSPQAGVAIEQADGRTDIEGAVNSGDATDLYEIVAAVTTPPPGKPEEKGLFSTTTFPNSRWLDKFDSLFTAQVLGPISTTSAVVFGNLAANSLTVDGPNGGEIAARSNTYKITWTSNVAGNIKIELLKAGVFDSLIAASEANDSEFLWLVPDTLALGSDYSIRLSSLTNVPLVTDTSDKVFTVQNPRFEILTPNGSESIGQGTTVKVQWKASITGKVKIELVKGSGAPVIISAIEDNDGLFSWNVPTDLAPGNDYRIKLSSLTNSLPVTDLSDGAFTARVPRFVLKTPDGGETIIRDNTYSIEWDAEIVGNVRVDLIKGSKVTPISVSEKNDGQFDWAVSAKTPIGKDYKIRVSSLTNPKAVSDESNSPFEVSNANFPLNGKFPVGWFKPVSKDINWKVVSGVSSEGVYSMVAEKVGDGNTASIAYKSDFKEGQIRFQMKVSSEANHDLARFYIDDVPQVLVAKTQKTSISGDVQWTSFTFPVTKGKHTFKWTYEKDDSLGDLKDSAWLDGVILPPTSQEIAVMGPTGVELADGSSSDTFPDTAKNSSSKARKFTVRNAGKAPLTDLKVSVDGKQSKDFAFTQLKTTTLDPGETATFQVVFTPSASGLRTANIHIRSNDDNEKDFTIGLQGTGIIPSIKSALASEMRFASQNSMAAAAWISAQMTSIESATPFDMPTETTVDVINGQKYLVLTVSKIRNVPFTARVEVSPNLVDWFSGDQHTTVLIDDETTLRVRDNTSVSETAKRYIRIK